MNIDETMSILRIIFENEGDIPTKLLISQQLWPLRSKQGANLLL